MENFDIVEGSLRFKYSTEENSERTSPKYRDHFHTEYELFYLMEGDVDFQIEQERYSVSNHDVLLIRPGQHHNVIFKSRTTYSRVVLRFNSSDITEALEKQVMNLPEVFNIRGLRSEEAYRTLISLRKTTIDACVSSAMKYQIGIILCSLCSEAAQKKEAKYISKDLEKAIQFIENNLASIHSEEDICKHINKSSSALRKLFVRNLNTPVMSYVRTKKCMKANELLKTGLSPKQIYRDCGFNYYSTFYRDYMRTYGKSPMSRSEN